MHCGQCGVAIVPDAAKFCWNCGIPVHGWGTASPPASASTSPASNLETCDIAVMDGSLNKGFFQANAHGPDRPYIAAKSPEFSMLSRDSFWLNQSEVHTIHEHLVTQLEASGWETLGTTGQDWWSTTFRRAIR